MGDPLEDTMGDGLGDPLGGSAKSEAEMYGILRVTILGIPRTLGGDRSSPGTLRDFNLRSSE